MNFTGGLPETVCGAGSTLRATSSLRGELAELLRQLNCRILVDAPCGDLNWMSRVDLSDIDYIGLDLDDKIETARAANMNAGSAKLEVRDIVACGFPAGDVLLCRDFLQHLPTQMVIEVVQHVVTSEAQWLIVTSHDVPSNEGDIAIGGFRPLNLRLPPFSWEPVASLEDCGRELLVFAVSDIRAPRGIS